MVSKTNKKTITKEEFYRLKSYQEVHRYLLEILESIELNALEITQEIEDDIEGRLLLGGITSDILNNFGNESIRDGLKKLGIEIEDENKENIDIRSKKDMGKVSKKKFKSGQWAKNRELNKPKEIIDSPELHNYLDDFKNAKLFLSEEELAEVYKIGTNTDSENAVG